MLHFSRSNSGRSGCTPLHKKAEFLEAKFSSVLWQMQEEEMRIFRCRDNEKMRLKPQNICVLIVITSLTYEGNCVNGSGGR